jgi:hypothetical protein
VKDHAHDDQIARYGLCLSCAEHGDDATEPEPARQLSLAEAQPDGDTYTPELDRVRLGAQAQRVLDLMLDGHWRSLAEIAEQTRDPEASISARLRDLRKPAHGGYIIDRRHRGDPTYGQFEYRLVNRGTVSDPKAPHHKDNTMDNDQPTTDPADALTRADAPAEVDHAGDTGSAIERSGSQHITHFRARNIRRLEAVEFEPGTGLIKIGGANGAGKTSVLDSILLALGGAQAQRAIVDPLRHGTTGGEIELVLGGTIRVTRSYNAEGKTKLTVRHVDGTPVPQQQTFLDSISGALQFDAAKFLRGTEAAQRDALLAVPMVAESLTIDPAALAIEREAVYGRRTEANREVKRLEVLLADTPAPEAGLPGEEVDASEVRAEYRDAQAHLRENDALRQRLETAGQMVLSADATVAALEQQLAEAKTAAAARRSEHSDLALQVQLLEDPDVTGLEARMDELEQINAKVRAAGQYRNLEQSLNAARGVVTELEADLDRIDRTKDEAMAKVQMPLDGLSFTDEGVTFHGVPLGGASGAEKVRVCAAIAVALNPECRVLCIPDASLLDSTSWAELADMAERENFQVFAEVVDETGTDGYVIEDGMLAGS